MSDQPQYADPFEFLKTMWGPMGQSLPGMVTPTLDVNEVDKRITELKTVETWLSMNLNMVKMTIQGLEVQKATLTAFHSMGAAAKQAGEAAQQAAGSSADAAATAAAQWPWNLMPQPANPPAPAPAGAAAAAKDKSKGRNKKDPEPGAQE
jgi:hypothetical protein